MKEEGAFDLQVRLRLLGGFDLFEPSGVPIRIRSRRTRCLLAILCLEGPGGVTRERLGGLLWGDRPDEQARGSLRQCLFDLRSELGASADALLEAGRERIAIRPEGISSDLSGLRQALQQGAPDISPEVVAALASGPLLYGLEASGPFQEWLDQARSAWEAELLHALSRRLEALEGEERWDTVRWVADAYLRRDPLQETVAAFAIRADLASGLPSAARRRYLAIKQALQDQLGVAPGIVLERAIKEAPKGEAQMPAPPAMAVASREEGGSGKGDPGGAPTLAVAPFINRSGLQEDEVFAFGMVEDIIEAVSQGVELRVISSSAAARFLTGSVPDLEGLIRHLGVRYLLEGDVRRVGDNLRVTAKLIEASRGSILWTARFDRPLNQLATLQEDLVLEMAAHLRAQSHRLEIERALRKPGNLTAWEAVMRSIAAYRRLSGAALLQAIVEAQRAVEISPNYALANALLAQNQGILYNQVLPDDPTGEQRICDIAEKAVALDPDNPVVLSTAAGAFSTTGRPARALELAERALQRNPNNVFAHFARGQALALLGRAREAEESFDRERQLAPDHPVLWISYLWRASALLGAGELTSAENAARAAIKLAPGDAGPHISLGMILYQMNRLEEAAEQVATGRRNDAEVPLDVWRRRYRRSHPHDGAADRLDAALVHLWSLTDPAAPPA